MTERTVGNYVVGPLLGSGGMSEVYAGHHRFLGNRVAIKLLRAHLADDARTVASFLAEATRTRATEHPNVVRVIDFGRDRAGCYLVMERIEGESLAARLARGRLDEAEARRIGAQIADGLALAHARGIVHRDLKPANVMLAGDTPKLVDFGIAAALDGQSGATGPRFGSLAYMAPEQLTGGLFAPCIDVWALGTTLFEMVSGRLPFEGFDGGRAPQLFETAPRLDGLVSPPLAQLIAQCLAREPALRPASMQQIAAALRAPASEGRVTEDLAGWPAAPTPSSGEVPAGELVRARELVAAAVPRSRRTRWLAIAAAPLLVIGAIAAWQLRSAVGPAALATPAAAAAPAPSPVTPASAAPAPSPVTPAAASVPSPVAPSSVSPAPALSPVTPAAVSPAPRPVAPVSGAAAPSPAPAGQSPALGSAAAAESAAPFTVELRSAPAGAAVMLDGAQIAVTPATLALAAPTTLTVVRRGYRPARVRAERAGPVDVQLVRTGRAHKPVAKPRPRAGETLD